MKTVWQGRLTQAAAKYGEVSQSAAVCCNACRTCMQANLIAMGLAAVAGAGSWVAQRLTRRRTLRVLRWLFGRQTIETEIREARHGIGSDEITTRRYWRHGS